MNGPTPSRGGTFNPFEEASCPDLHSAWEEGFRACRAGRPVPERHRKSSSSISTAWLNGYTAARLSARPSAKQKTPDAGGPTDPQAGPPEGSRQGQPQGQKDREADASAELTSGPQTAKILLEVSITDTAAAEALPDGTSLLGTLTPVEQEGARYGYRQAGRPFGPTRRGLEIWLRLRARARAG